MKVKGIVLTVLVMICSAGGWAQTPPEQASRDSVMKFFAAAQIEQQITRMQSLMSSEMTKAIQQMLDRDDRLTAEDKKKALDALGPDLQDAAAIYPVPEMLQDIAPVYQKHFTESDMQAITAFFETPVGKKFINESGPMMQEAMAVMMPKMNERMQSRMDQMRRRIDDLTKQPPPTPQKQD